VKERLTFDSEAILAFFLGQTGGDLVRDSLKKIQSSQTDGYINIISLAELYYVLSRISPETAEEKQRNLRLYGLKIIPVEDNGLWREAAQFKCNHSMSLGDAFAVATAKSLETKLVEAMIRNSTI
jgi:predicted nucleic acid-binding protein